MITTCIAGCDLKNALCDWSPQPRGGYDIPVAMATSEDLSVINEPLGRIGESINRETGGGSVHHSSRSATMGLMCIARRAGIEHAASATSTRRMQTPPNVAGS